MVKNIAGFLILGIILSSCTLKWIQDRVPPPEMVSGGKVLMRLDSPSAKTVFIAGDFNGWEHQPSDPRAVAMKKNSSGIWEAKFKVNSGRYQYKFVLDSYSWILDPHNPLTLDDGKGNINSLLIVK